MIKKYKPEAPWCTQDQLRPISKATLRAVATKRTQELAIPKKDFSNPGATYFKEIFFSPEGRPSTIWTVPPLALNAHCSLRTKQLAKPKAALEKFEEYRNRTTYETLFGRPSQIWTPTTTLTIPKYKWSPRTNYDLPRYSRIVELSKPRRHAPLYVPNKCNVSVVHRRALAAATTRRTKILAIPKIRMELERLPSITKVSKAALECKASEYINSISKPRLFPSGYLPLRVLPIAVSKPALKAEASDRITEISIPIIRPKTELIMFDMSRQKVKPEALTAYCSKRTEELAVPKVRK